MKINLENQIQDLQKISVITRIKKLFSFQSRQKEEQKRINQNLKRKNNIEQKFKIKLPNYYTKQLSENGFPETSIMLPSTQANILKAYDEHNYKICQEQLQILANKLTYQIIVNHLAKVEQLKQKLSKQTDKNTKLSLLVQDNRLKKQQGLDQKQKQQHVFSEIIFLLKNGLYNDALSKIKKDLSQNGAQNFIQFVQYYGCFRKFLDHMEKNSQISALKNSNFTVQQYLQSKETNKFKKIINQQLINKNKRIEQCIDKIGVASSQKQIQCLTATIQSNTLRIGLQKIYQKLEDLRTIVNTWESSINRIIRNQQLDFDLALLDKQQTHLKDKKYQFTKKINEIDPMLLSKVKQVQKKLRAVKNRQLASAQLSQTSNGQHMLASEVNLIQKFNSYYILNQIIATKNKPNLVFMQIQTSFQKTNRFIDRIMLSIENLLFENFQRVDENSCPTKAISLPSKETMINWYLDQIRVQLGKLIKNKQKCIQSLQSINEKFAKRIKDLEKQTILLEDIKKEKQELQNKFKTLQQPLGHFAKEITKRIQQLRGLRETKQQNEQESFATLLPQILNLMKAEQQISSQLNSKFQTQDKLINTIIFNQQSDQSDKIMILNQLQHGKQQKRQIQKLKQQKMQPQNKFQGQKMVTKGLYQQKSDQRFAKFFVGQIMDYQDYTKRTWLVKTIEQKNERRFKRTRLLYRFDKQIQINFYKYINYQPHIVLIAKTENNRIIGGYSKGAFIPSQQSRDYGMIFTLTKQDYFEKKSGRNFKANSYDKHCLVFGNYDISIKVFADTIQINKFGTAQGVFETKGETADYLLGKGENVRQDKMVTYELYSIEFE